MMQNILERFRLLKFGTTSVAFEEAKGKVKAGGRNTIIGQTASQATTTVEKKKNQKSNKRKKVLLRIIT